MTGQDETFADPADRASWESEASRDLRIRDRERKLVEKIVRDYGSDRGRMFLDDATRIAITSITLMGFSTGIDEEDIPDEAKIRIKETLNEAEYERVEDGHF